MDTIECQLCYMSEIMTFFDNVKFSLTISNHQISISSIEIKFSICELK